MFNLAVIPREPAEAVPEEGAVASCRGLVASCRGLDATELTTGSRR